MKIVGIDITHPRKILYPGEQIDKQMVATYYKNIAPFMLPFLKKRPITFKRYPNGVEEPGFFIKRAQDYYPDFLEILTIPMHGHNNTIDMICINKVRDLIYLASLNTIEFHVALSTSDNINNPDQIIFDFDPSDNDFNKVRHAALTLKQILDKQNLPSFVKTTGSRGLHVHIPIKTNISFNQAKLFSRALAEVLYSQCPDITTLAQRKDKRGNKVFIDYLRNDYGMTAIAPFSLRAQNNAPIAMPISWDEVNNKDLNPQSYCLSNILKQIAQKKNPWQTFSQSAIDIKS